MRTFKTFAEEMEASLVGTIKELLEAEDLHEEVATLHNTLLKHGYMEHHPHPNDLSYKRGDRFYKNGQHLVATSGTKSGRNWAHYPHDGSGLTQGTGTKSLHAHLTKVHR